MLKSVVLLFPLAVSLMLAQAPAPGELWDHVQGNDALEIYLRSNADGSVSVRSVVTLDAEFPEVLPYLENPANFTHWLAEVAQSEVLGEVVPQTDLVYFTLEPPSTYQRYDAAIGYTTQTKEDNRYFVAKLESLYDSAPDALGYQRLRTIQGYFALRQPTGQPLKLLVQLTVNFGPEMNESQTRAKLQEFVSQSADNLMVALTLPPPVN